MDCNFLTRTDTGNGHHFGVGRYRGDHRRAGGVGDDDWKVRGRHGVRRVRQANSCRAGAGYQWQADNRQFRSS